MAAVAATQREAAFFGNRGVSIFASPRREFAFELRTVPAAFLAGRLFVGSLFPGSAAIGRLIADVVGRVPDGCVLRVNSVNPAQIAGDGSADSRPVAAAVCCEQ